MESKSHNSTETKRTVIKSVTAIACTLSLCLSANSAIGKYSDSIIKISEAQKGTHISASTDNFSSDNIASNNPTDISSDDSISPSDNSAQSDTSNSDSSTLADNNVSNNSTSNDSAAPNTNDPTKYSVAQVVNYYNTSLKNTYNLPKLTIDKVEDIKIVIDNVTPGGNLVTKVCNKIIENYAKATPSSASFEKSKNVSGGDDAQEFSMHANLDPAGVKSATVKKIGNGYEINIALKPEQATLQNRPTFNSQCANPLDLYSVDLFGVEITQADFNYPGTTLKATVDANGRVKNAVSYMPMNGTGAGKFVGISGSATVHGSMTKSATFKF